MSRYAWMTNVARGIAAGGCALALLAGSAGALSSAWITDGSGNWSTATNWNNGVPINAGDVAYITNPVTAPAPSRSTRR